LNALNGLSSAADDLQADDEFEVELEDGINLDD
jgi:hypothetical protein